MSKKKEVVETKEVKENEIGFSALLYKYISDSDKLIVIVENLIGEDKKVELYLRKDKVGRDRLLVVSKGSKIKNYEGVSIKVGGDKEVKKITIKEAYEMDKIHNVLFVINHSWVYINDFFHFEGVSLINNSKLYLGHIHNSSMHKVEMFDDLVFTQNFGIAKILPFNSSISNTNIFVNDALLIEDCKISRSNLRLYRKGPLTLPNQHATTFSNLNLTDSVLDSVLDVAGDNNLLREVVYHISEIGEHTLPKGHIISLDNLVTPTTLINGSLNLGIYTVIDRLGKIDGIYIDLKNSYGALTLNHFITFDENYTDCNNELFNKLKVFLGNENNRITTSLIKQLTGLIKYRSEYLMDYRFLIKHNKIVN